MYTHTHSPLSNNHLCTQHFTEQKKLALNSSNQDEVTLNVLTTYHASVRCKKIIIRCFISTISYYFNLFLSFILRLKGNEFLAWVVCILIHVVTCKYLKYTG